MLRRESTRRDFHRRSAAHLHTKNDPFIRKMRISCDLLPHKACPAQGLPSEPKRPRYLAGRASTSSDDAIIDLRWSRFMRAMKLMLMPLGQAASHSA